MTERIAVAEPCCGRVLAEQADLGLATRGLRPESVLDYGMRAGIPSVLVRKPPRTSGDGVVPPESTSEFDLRFRHARGRPAMDILRDAVIRFRRTADETRC